jgi:hypothetical protein
MTGYPAAYSPDALQDCINANTSCPDVGEDELERILDLAERRAQARGEDSALEDTETDCLVATDWASFAEDRFGYDASDFLNHFAIGVLDMRASVGKDATLFTDTYVIQQSWLHDGDGRRTQVEQYTDDYEGNDGGDMWVPKGAQDYVAIIKLPDDLVHDEPALAEAM